MALSLDLRRSIFAARESGKYSVRQISEIFGVAKATVKSLIRLKQKTGSLVPRKGGPTALPIWTDTSLHEIVRDLIAEDNHATLEEYCDRLEGRAGTRISVPQMCELLQQLKLYRKKNSSRERRRLREG
jgi:transposase